MNPPLPQLPDTFKTALEQMGHHALIGPQELERLPPQKGAYLLVIAIAEPFDLTIKTLEKARIEPAIYVYCGSARGPGGIKARLRRHFARDKCKHWHIDHLSLPAARLWALVVPDGNECTLRSDLAQTAGFSVPIKGFGASDCTSCPSHLLRWSEG